MTIILIFLIFLRLFNLSWCESTRLDRSLKILRNDFNQLIENVENFVDDVAKEIHQSSSLLENVYFNNNEDYNWQDNVNVKNKFVKTAEKYDSKENEISKRTKRSPNDKKDQLCTTNTQKEIDIEQAKLQELKVEIQKLGNVVELLKDQQRIIKNLNREEDSANKPSNYLTDTVNQLKNKEKVNKNQESDRKWENDMALKSNISNIEKELKETKEALIDTRQLVTEEKIKEDLLENAFNKQKTEMKFVKAMMENLYDNKNSNKRNVLTSKQSSDSESILGYVHTPRPMPAFELRRNSLMQQSRQPNSADENDKKHGKQGNTSFFADEYPTKETNPEEEEYLEYIFGIGKYKNKFDNSENSSNGSNQTNIDITNNNVHDVINNNDDDNNSDEDDYESGTINRPININDFIHNIKDMFNVPDPAHLDELANNQTIEALMKLAAKDPNRFKLYGLNENENNKISLQKSRRHRNMLTRKNNFSRANGRDQDLELRLRLINLLMNGNKQNNQNEVSNKEETDLDQALNKLLHKEKNPQSDLTFDSLKSLLKPQKTNTETSLIALLENAKPQSKTDDLDVENELKELQKAINSLKPKDENIEVNKRKEAAQEFQAMLSQLITQNQVHPSDPVIEPPNPQIFLPPPEQNFHPNPSVGYYNIPPYAYNSYPYTYLYNGPNSANRYGNSWPPYLPNKYPYFNSEPTRLLPYGYSTSPQSKPQEILVEGETISYGGNNFFPSPGPYPETSYNQANYPKSSLDQQYGNQQNVEQNKYDAIQDLNQQIGHLEEIIRSLAQRGSNYGDDSVAIATLEQRIYDLKGVIHNLNSLPPPPQPSGATYNDNKPVYPPPQKPLPQQYPNNQPPSPPVGPSTIYQGPPPKDNQKARRRMKRQTNEERSNESLNKLTDFFHSVLGDVPHKDMEATRSNPVGRNNKELLGDLEKKLGDLKLQIQETISKVIH
ncbi:hypothetical protein ABEB36_008859 [Hypothenemus hampei]|uniref:Uncharacterized protein n=1 Tax=Hypothenemus hampei TaxID=57062 RepID=A0ABD1ENB9_HYPHA